MDQNIKLFETHFRELVSIMDEVNIDNDSLFDGNMGLCLLQFYLGRALGEERHFVNAENTLFRIIENFETNKINLNGHSYCSGTTGFCYGLNHLAKEGYIDFDSTQVDKLDEVVYRWAINELEFNNTDFLYGALGVIHYFTEKKTTSTIRGYLTNLVNKLGTKALATEDGQGIYFLNHSTPFKNSGLDKFVASGVAHGMTGIMLVLLKVHELGVCTEGAKDLIKGGIHFLLSKKREVDNKLVFSFFPIYIDQLNDDNIYNPKLAWCNGDIGIALLLHRAGKAFNNQYWKDMGMSIAKDTCKRVDFAHTDIKSIHLCHGSGGVAAVYETFYQLTGLEQFGTSYNYWVADTVNQLAERRPMLNIALMERNSILSGIGGAIFPMLSKYPSDNIINWKNAFLL